jgi:hypothetical protein
LIATVVSFVLCLLYFWFLPFTIAGMMSVIGFGTLVMMLLDRRDDIVTAGITTVVVMLAAAIDPQHAWQQPLLRFIDTIVGIGWGYYANGRLLFCTLGSSGNQCDNTLFPSHPLPIAGTSKPLEIEAIGAQVAPHTRVDGGGYTSSRSESSARGQAACRTLVFRCSIPAGAIEVL